MKCSLLSCKSKFSRLLLLCKEVFILFLRFRKIVTNFISFFCIILKKSDYTVKKCIL